MKKRITILLMLAMFLIVNVAGVALEAENYPEDIQNHWAKSAIENHAKSDILDSLNEPFFYPEKPITKKEFLVMLKNVVPVKYSQSVLSEGYISRDEAIELLASSLGYACWL